MDTIAYEPIEVDSGGALWFAFAMILLLAGSSLFIGALQQSFLAVWGRAPTPLQRPYWPDIPPLVTEPPLQGTPDYRLYGPAEVAALQRGAERQLHTFGFYDRDQGLVHIPIELAMQLLLVEQSKKSQEKKP